MAPAHASLTASPPKPTAGTPTATTTTIGFANTSQQQVTDTAPFAVRRAAAATTTTATYTRLPGLAPGAVGARRNLGEGPQSCTGALNSIPTVCPMRSIAALLLAAQRP